MKKAIPTILATIIFLAVIASYAWGVLHVLANEPTIETIMLPFIILIAFSVVSVLLIIILVKRVKAIKEEDKKEYDEY